MEAKAPLRYADIGLLPRIPLRRYLVTSGFGALQGQARDRCLNTVLFPRSSSTDDETTHRRRRWQASDF
ncbi:MAG: hypothetical protein U1E74_07995 [Paenacidovorax caeni]